VCSYGEVQSIVLKIFVHHNLKTSGTNEVKPAVTFQEKLEFSLIFKCQGEIGLTLIQPEQEVRRDSAPY
jgi:hypothetical protein